jgi:uncharacterized phage-like protein YoqJ
MNMDALVGGIVAGTGHRPNKLGGYNQSVNHRLVSLALEILTEIKPDHVISGMAQGWDQALARAATELGIPWTAAVPFFGQESAWPKAAQRRYFDLLNSAADTVIVCQGGYSPEKMQRRNEWMVDRADKVLALWDGSRGGTGNCILYAERKRTPIINVWERFAKEAA